MGTASERAEFLKEHSLSIVSAVILAFWIVAYTRSSPATHVGSFFGNAIADWTGVVVTVLATKYLYEIGSAESRQPHGRPHSRLRKIARDHSLTAFLLITGAGWVWLFSRMDAEAKWGQVVGNIVSEWTQIAGLVLLTKRLVERNSKESTTWRRQPKAATAPDIGSGIPQHSTVKPKDQP